MSWYTPEGTRTADTYTTVTSATTSMGSGVYVADGDVTIKDSVRVKGDAVLVLRDGCSLNCTKGIIVEGSGSITISTPEKDGTGKLTATGNYSAGIGGEYWHKNYSGTVTIDGGHIDATGSNGGAGIGSGGYDNDPFSRSSVIINSGTVKAVGSESAAGIGGGIGEYSGPIKINGGTVSATGGSGAAGIGGGSMAGKDGDQSSVRTVADITISGATVTAQSSSKGGAGIGGGYGERIGRITISGSTVEATGEGGGAGIGGGFSNNTNRDLDLESSISITGGKVTAKAENGGGAGIGGGYKQRIASISIKDCDVSAIGCDGGAGIGGAFFTSDDAPSPEGTISIEGGTVYARADGSGGAGIGGGYRGPYRKVELNGVSCVDAHGGDNGAGIGGGSRCTVRDLIITNCPDVRAYGGSHASGIGGGDNASCDSIRITSCGITRAVGGSAGAGIGSGSQYYEPDTPGSISIVNSSVNASGGINAAGIGGGSRSSVSDITIKGSGQTISATGGSIAAGIGGGLFGTSGNVEISGDVKVIANGGERGAGIGSGGDVPSNTQAQEKITIDLGSAGEIEATGGSYAAGIGGGDIWAVKNIIISGNGKISAKGGQGGAGIGTGAQSKNTGRTAIDISGCDINAKGGAAATGIGGGLNSICDSIKITGGTIYAEGKFYSDSGGISPGAGIGSGSYIGNSPVSAERARNASIEISGGRVTAKGAESAAGIGGGVNSFYGKTVISGGTVIAYGGSNADDIGAGYLYDGNDCHFSTGENGCAVIIARTITDTSDKGNWSCMYFKGKGPSTANRGVVLSPTKKVDVSTAEYIPAGYVMDVQKDEYITFSIDKKDFENYGKIYVKGSHANLEENDLTDVDDGDVIYGTCTVKFESNGGTSIASQEVESGEKAAKPSAPNKDGYTFDGWYTDKDCTNEYDFSTPVTKDITLYAKWKSSSSTEPSKDKYFTVTFESNGGSTVSPQKVKAGAMASEPDDPERDGYTFVGWYADKRCTDLYDFQLPVNKDITLYAYWEKDRVKPDKPDKPVVHRKRILNLVVTSTGSTSEKLRWNRISGARGYDIYMAKCGTDLKKYRTVRGRTAKTRTLRVRGLKKGREYKYYIRAFKYRNGRKVYIANGLAAHSIVNNRSWRCTNARKLTVSPTRAQLSAGDTLRIRRSTKKWSSSRELLGPEHTAVYRFRCDTPEVASVSRKGVITAKKAGTCKVYVSAQNGLYKVIRITVK